MSDLLYSEEEEALRAAVRDLLTDHCDTTSVLARAESDAPHDPALWKTLADGMGLAGLLVPEDRGGQGATHREAAVVLEELGRAVAPVPYLTSAVVATEALLACADGGDLLEGLASGRVIGALAVGLHTAPGAAYATVRADGGVRGAGCGVQAHGERADHAPGRQALEQVPAVRAGQQRLGRDDGARQVRHGSDRAPQLLQDDRCFAVGRALAAPVLGDQQPGEAHAVGEGLPQGRVVRGVRLGAGEHGRRVAVVGEQVPDGGAERLFLLRVQKIAHRARSFQATSLSVRGSAGRPRTRSATMFSRTSLVPPSMLLPLERR